MATIVTATWTGSISVFLWGTLALLTKLSGGKIPEFQLMAMTFGIAFLLMCVRCKCSHRGGFPDCRQGQTSAGCRTWRVVAQEPNSALCVELGGSKKTLRPVSFDLPSDPLATRHFNPLRIDPAGVVIKNSGYRTADILP